MRMGGQERESAVTNPWHRRVRRLLGRPGGCCSSLRLLSLGAISVAVALSACGGAPGQVESATEVRLGPRCEQAGVFSGRLAVGVPRSTTAPTAAPTVTPDGTGTSPADSPDYAVRLDSIAVSAAAEGAEVRYQLAGDGFVAWSATFVDLATLYGSDAEVAVAGACVLKVDLSGIASDTVDPAAAATPQRVADAAAAGVVEVLWFPSSDGIGQSFVGTRSSTPRVAVDAPLGAQAITISVSPSP